MKALHQRAARWAAAASFVLALAGCGGGGGGGAGDSAGSGGSFAGSEPDARNGSYTLIAADAREYTLILNFNARAYQLTGNGVDQAGTFTDEADAFHFQPGNASGASGSSTTRFTMATDAAIGELVLPAGTVPFIAARKFATALADATGTYDFLGRTVDTSGAAANTTIQQAEISAGGELRTCEDAAIHTIATCTLVSTGALSVSGNVFTAATSAGNVPFRVALIGSDKVFLRASASSGTTRRFIVGTPATATFTGASFVGGTTEPAWGTVTLTATGFSSTGTAPNGTASTTTGTAASAGIESIRLVTTASAGNFFATRSSELGVVVAGRDSVAAPGFMAIGKKQ